MHKPSQNAIHSVDKLLAFLALFQAAVVSPGFIWLEFHTPKGSKSYDPDDVFFDLLSTVALLLLLSYGLWNRKAWAFVALGIGSAAALIAVLALPHSYSNTWWSIPILAALLFYAVWRFWLEPTPR